VRTKATGQEYDEAFDDAKIQAHGDPDRSTQASLSSSGSQGDDEYAPHSSETGKGSSVTVNGEDTKDTRQATYAVTSKMSPAMKRRLPWMIGLSVTAFILVLVGVLGLADVIDLYTPPSARRGVWCGSVWCVFLQSKGIGSNLDR